MIQGLALLLLAGSFLHPARARVTFWVTSSGEYDYVIKAHLGGDTDRICGTVTKDGQLWDSMSFTSGGAHVGISRTDLPLDAAKFSVEQDCR